MESGELQARRKKRARDEVEAPVVATLRRQLATDEGSKRLADAAAAVVAGRTDAYACARELVEWLAATTGGV